MFARIKEFLEFLWLYFKGFRPVEFVRGEDRISLHAFGWRANGTGRMKRAKDAVAYLDSAGAEQWRQIYCGMTPFLVSDKGNVKHIDGKPAKLFLANGRYQILYKPEDARGRGKNGRDHKKRVYRSMLVAMAFLDFKKGDTTHEIHHVNGYRTDDRLANLLVLTHEEHTRIHNMGPCGLSGTRDEALAALAAAAPVVADKKTKKAGGKTAVADDAAAETPASHQASADTEETIHGPEPSNTAVNTSAASDAAPQRDDDGAGKQLDPTAAATGGAADDAAATDTPPAKKRRRGRRGGKKRRKAAAPEQTAPTANDETHEEESGNAENPPVEAEAPQKEKEASLEKKSSAKRTEQDAAIDWENARQRLETELAAYLEKCAPDASKDQPSDKQLTQWGKPVYRAYKPFLTCPDAITQFDATLACVRAIVRAESSWEENGPAQLQSLLGALMHTLKHAVNRLAAEDDVVRSCVEELLREEMAKPEYAKTTAARGFRQSLAIIGSQEENRSGNTRSDAEN